MNLNKDLNLIDKLFWLNKEVLITGGTGTLGKALTKKLLKEYPIKGIRIYSRDEAKQDNFRYELEKENLLNKVSFLIGDVRDKERLDMAMKKVNIVIHTAAMKQVPACEYNPIEAVKTNINGAVNVVSAAINNGVEKVMNIATDKGVYPINFYGCTKAVAEKLFTFANVYSPLFTKFSSCRYGNVLGSRGSIIPLFKKQFEEKGYITITHKDMTRFWISLNRVVQFVLDRIEEVQGGEIFAPIMKSMSVIDLAKLIVPNTKINVIGIRDGEKLHEYLISKEEMERTVIHSNQSYDYFEIRKYGSEKMVNAYSSDIAVQYNNEEMLKLLEE
jgi:FlaA1/EpsC-like NDP-sugar epimerase